MATGTGAASLHVLRLASVGMQSLALETEAHGAVGDAIRRLADEAIWVPAVTPLDRMQRALQVGPLEPALTGWDFPVRASVWAGNPFCRGDPMRREDSLMTVELKAARHRDPVKRGPRAKRSGEWLYSFAAHPNGSVLSATAADVLLLSWRERAALALKDKERISFQSLEAIIPRSEIPGSWKAL